MRYLLVILAHVLVAAAQEQQPPQGRPLYQVTIVSRSTKALNYGYLTEGTRIGFKGTPLIPEAKGEAKVQVKRGSTVVEAKFNDVPPPTRFGAQYLTYVLWAISTDGRAQNLGEVTLNSSDKGKLTTSTTLQSFAMIVTAEPYYSVTQPSDVVVLENVVIPGTVGKVEELNATYELLPRKSFTYEADRSAEAPGRMVSRQEYDAILAIYQAQNAIQIAESADAAKYAPQRLTQAKQLLERARTLPKTQSAEIVSTAREAVQVAEDSRAIAAKRSAK